MLRHNRYSSIVNTTGMHHLLYLHLLQRHPHKWIQEDVEQYLGKYLYTASSGA